MSRHSHIVCCAHFLAATLTFGQDQKPVATPAPVSFSKDLAPILAKKCVACHGPEKSKGHFRLDSIDWLMKAGESKSAPIVPGQPEQSELVRRLTATLNSGTAAQVQAVSSFIADLAQGL